MKNATEIAFVLDASGSMDSIVDDAVGGFNSFLREQQAVPGEARFSLLTFNTRFSWVVDNVNLAEVRPLTRETYVPNGQTALLDALGRAIDRVGAQLRDTPEPQRPDKVLIVVFTDGAENSSREYSQQKIAQMIEHQQDVYKWQFVFLAANVDAIASAAAMGINTANVANYQPSKIQHAYAAAGQVVASYRVGKSSSASLGALRDENDYILSPEEAAERQKQGGGWVGKKQQSKTADQK